MKTLMIRTLYFYLFILPMIGISVSCTEKYPVIEGTVNGIGNTPVYIHAFDGQDLKLIDSVKSRNNVFVFNMSPERKHGMYHLRWGKNPADGIDVIYNYSDVRFTTPKDSIHLMVFQDSPDNDLFFAFYPIRITIEHLSHLGDMMNRADPIGNKAKLIELNHYLDSLEYAVQQMLDDLDRESKDLFAYKIIRSAFYPNYDYELKMNRTEKQDPYLFMQKNFFNHIDFNEPGLIRTPFLHSSIEDFMGLYVYPPTEEQYKRASDLIISKAAVNDEMYDYVVSLLVHTFEQSDFLEVYLYLMEIYQSELCEGDNLYEDQHKLYEIVRQSRPGSQASDIAGTTPEGKTVSLYGNAENKAVVLLFWDPDCDHCKIIIEQLVAMWPSYRAKGISVVTFALTKYKDDWMEAIQEHHMENFLNMTDMKDTESQAFSKYHIRGTPEIYLITEDFQIFSRPSNYIELDRDLNQIINFK